MVGLDEDQEGNGSEPVNNGDVNSPHIEDLVRALVTVFGERALSVAELQVQAARGEPYAERIWREILDRIRNIDKNSPATKM